MTGARDGLGGWLQQTFHVGFLQLAVQGLGFASGILLIRFLPKEEYAWYTIALSVQAMSSILADMGLGLAMISFGGPVWNDRARLGQVVASARHVRRRMLIPAALAGSGIMSVLLWRQGAGAGVVCALVAGVIWSLRSQLDINLLAVLPRLHTRVARLQMLELSAAATRVALLLMAVTIWINAAVGVMIGALVFAGQRAVLVRWSGCFILRDAEASPADTAAMWARMRSQLAVTLSTYFQSGIGVWLLSLYGATSSIADLGALSRLALIFVVPFALVTNLVVPHMARCPAGPHLLRRYLRFSVVGAGGAAVLVCMAALSSPLWLALLGSQYGHLRFELILTAINSGVSFFLALLWGLNASRGWVKNSWVFLPATLCAQLAVIVLLDISTVRGVLLVSISGAVSGVLVLAVLGARGLYEARLIEHDGHLK